MANFTLEEVKAMEAINKKYDNVKAIHVVTKQVEIGEPFTSIELYVEFPEDFEITRELESDMFFIFPCKVQDGFLYCAYPYLGRYIKSEKGEAKVWRKE